MTMSERETFYLQVDKDAWVAKLEEESKKHKIEQRLAHREFLRQAIAGLIAHEGVGASDKLAIYIDNLESESMDDPLTGALNRKVLITMADHIVARAQNQGKRVAFVMLDVDNFKTINDKLGHPVGDKALHLLYATLKESDEVLVARWGGEEWAVLLPFMDNEELKKTIEGLGNRIRKVMLDDSDLQKLGQVTASMGISMIGLAGDMDLINKTADGAVYQAKHDGRNRAVIDFGDGQEKVSIVFEGKPTPTMAELSTLGVA